MFLVFSLSAMAQLNLSVAPTDAACAGQGLLTFSVTGNDPAATITYTIYGGANTSAPQVGTVTQTSTSTPPYQLRNLAAGTYTVVATQVIGGVTTTSAPRTVVISTTTLGAAYTPVIQGTRCGTDGKVTINVDRGVPVRYDLYAGNTPSGAPIATVNAPAPGVFENLAVGDYTAVMTDACGDTGTVSVNIIQETTNVLLDAVTWPVQAPLVLGEDWSLVDCNHIAPQHRISTVGQQNIFYPVDITYTVTSPQGVVQAPVVQHIETGSNNQSFRSEPILFYPCEQYTYTMSLRDACGNVFNSPINVLNECFEVTWEVNYGHCDESIIFTAKNWAPPFVVTFTPPTASTFNPADHNDPLEHPNFAGPAATYNNHVPDGTYGATVSNCGRTVVFPAIIVQKPDQELILNGTIPCGETEGVISGAFTKTQTDFLHVNIVAPFPPGYTGPTNLDSGINPLQPSEFSYGPLPDLGTYWIAAESECPEDGILLVPVTFTRGNNPLVIDYTSRAGCEEGVGSIWIHAVPPPPAGGSIVGVTIQRGPAAWEAANPGARPVDVSVNVAADGMFYMNSLPEGEYEFNVIDACGPSPYVMNVTGYHNTVRTATVDVNCVTFQVTVDVQGNNNLAAGYWLQKKDGNNWVHPVTNVVYTPGATPTAANSVRLTGPTLSNGVYTPGVTASSGTGEFRVIEVYSIYANGLNTGARCLTELATFRSGIPPEITGVFSFPCSENSGEVIVNALTSGDPSYVRYSVDGGTPQVSNVFSGLLPNTPYTFTVTDRCNTVNQVAQIQDAPPLVVARTGTCDGQDVVLSLPEFNFLTYEWYNVAAPTVILSNNGTLTLPAFDSATDAGTYAVRVANPTNAQSCLNQTIQYVVAPNALPSAGADNITMPAICTGSVATVDLATYLVAPFDAGGTYTLVSGTGGTLTGSVFDISTITTGGTFDFNYTSSNTCGNTDVALLRVRLIESPAAATIDPVAVQCEGSNIRLVATSTTTTPGLVYSWTGPNGYTFTGATAEINNAVIANSGDYTVVVSNGVCDSAPTTINVTVTAAPNAGDPNTTPICNDVAGTVLDLADYLVAPFDAGGTWALAATNTPPAGSFDVVNSTFDTAGLIGTYDFTYSVTACGTTDVAVITFVLNAIPNAPVATVAAAVVCENGSIQLNTPAVAGATYSWTKGGSVVSTAQNPNIPATLAAAGDYVLTISVNGCTADSAPVNVVVTPLPQFSLAGNTVICPTQFTTLSVVPTNFALTDAAISYQWTLNGASVSNAPTARVDALGDYIVTVTNANGGCPTSHTITVTADPDPFSIVLEGDCVNEHFIMSITNIADIGTTQSIVWSGPGISETAGNNPTIDLTAKAIGIYSVTVTNADGCFKTQTIDVTSTSCMIPRGISPEEVDGKNDFFDLTNLGVQNLQIFNRYGLQVYEKNNYTKEWYGQSDKGDLPTGTYFYVAKMADKQVTGWVYIQRNSN
ncbi:hypothetical protein Q765_06835 [Flavobacterium rivuli WB 3.3-2 = DSM 21788]|uniref:Ig-like domain-containing protein n=2 Tax=Flavobacterium rivuli TaxID=498301 RepID=A0A0A2M513_9FLAO|nr:hypothetical protein Q765_06835 [Flavobacterium rivuli WB 3.3-2 = DSM 21788]